MHTFSFYQNVSFFFISIFSREKKHIYMFIYSVCILSFFQENFERIKLLPEEELNSSLKKRSKPWKRLRYISGMMILRLSFLCSLRFILTQELRH